ncbi:MAG: AAA family ATPase [Eubacterium sp.]|nr:AAA family ATPase [Eubacterium sp.]
MQVLKIGNVERFLSDLFEIEEEMQEDSYWDTDSEKLRMYSQYAHIFIRKIVTYLKENFREERCNVLVIMQELYRVGVTGEYGYLQKLEKMDEESEFQYLRGSDGCRLLRYTVCLLRYYFLANTNFKYYDKERGEVDDLYKKVSKLKSIEKRQQKQEEDEEEETYEVEEENFMLELRKHMDTNMVGQDVLKKKLCSIIYQWKYQDVRTNFLMVGPSGSGKNHMIDTIKSFPGLEISVVIYDCSSLTPTGFKGNEVTDIFKRIREVLRKNTLNNLTGRGNKSSKRCIVYLDEIDKIINFNHDSRGESVNAMVQQQLLSALAGTEEIEGVDTKNLLFILGGAFPRIDELEKEEKKPVGFSREKECAIDYKNSLREQIHAIGGEVEFIGRIEDIMKMPKLTRSDLKAIMLDPNSGAFYERQKVFQNAGLNLEMEEDVVEEILNRVEGQAAGARYVKNFITQLAGNEYFYDLKTGNYDTLRIHKGMLEGEQPVLLRGGKRADESCKEYA